MQRVGSVSEGMEKQEGSIQSEGVPERDRMEQALRRSEEKYRFLFERSPAVNLIIGADGRIRDVTNSFAERLGYSNDEILGRQALEFVVAEQREKVATVLEMAFKGQDTPEMDVDIYAKDGSVHTIFSSPGQAMLRQEGQPTGVLFTGADITERKRAEKALSEREEQYRLLIERQREGLTIIDLEEQFVFCNPAGDEIFGVPRGGLVDRNVREFTTPETFEFIRKQTERRRAGESSTYEVEIIRSDGGKRQLLTTAAPWTDKDGRIVGALAIFRDETDRKRMEEEVRSLARFPAENPNPVLRLDKNGIVLATNEASKTLLPEWKPEVGQVAPKFWCDLVTEALSTGLSKNIDVESDGKFYSFFVKPITEAGYVNLYGRDTTERKRAEEALRRRAEELAALQATVLDITSRHELSGLLGAIIERAVRLLNAHGGDVFLCDPERREVRCVVSYNLAQDYTGTVLKYGQGASGTVAETGEPLIIDDYRTWQRRAAFYEKEQRYTAIISVPTTWQGKVTGVINVIDDVETRRFTQADLDLLTLFANHAAIAVENTRLLEQEQRHAAELQRYSTSLEQLVLQRTGKLAESERRFRELAELLPQIVFEIDGQGNLLFANRITLALTGYGEDDLRRGLNAFQMFAPEDHDRARQSMQRILSGEKLRGDEYTIQRKDGSTFPAIVNAAPIMRGNKPVGLRGIVIDITERKRMEDELRATGDRLQFLLSSSPAMIYTAKAYGDCRTTFISENFRDVLGYDPRELLEDPNFWKSHIHPEDRARTLEAENRVLREGHGIYEYRFQHRDGTYRWMREEARVVRDVTGNPLETIGYWIDITDRKHAEEELLESEERFRGIAERSFDSIFTMDQEGHITYTSPAGERLFGYTLEEASGKSFQDFVPESQIPKLAQVFAEVRKGKPVTGLEIQTRRKDGSLASVEINASPIIRDGQFAGLQGIARDITERKRMEQKLRDSEERFRGIAERSIDGIFEVDAEGRVTYVSPSVESALGYKPEEVIGTRMERYLAESEIPKIAPNMAADRKSNV